MSVGGVSGATSSSSVQSSQSVENDDLSAYNNLESGDRTTNNTNAAQQDNNGWRVESGLDSLKDVNQGKLKMSNMPPEAQKVVEQMMGKFMFEGFKMIDTNVKQGALSLDSDE
jgi:Fe-S cluster biosynthesis and repair protein YggX